MKTIMKWWNKPNRAYTKVCQEVVTNGQVILTNLTCCTIILACGIAEWLNK